MTYQARLPEVFPFVADVTRRQAEHFAYLLLHSVGSFAVTCDNYRAGGGRVYFWMSDAAKTRIEHQAVFMEAVQFQSTAGLRQPGIEVDTDGG